MTGARHPKRPEPSRPMRALLGPALLAVALLALAACGGGGATSDPHTTASAQDRAAMANPDLDTGSSLGGVPAPDFRLANQFGQQMSLSQFRGKVVILAFTDSECTTICPLTTVSMVEARQMLGAAGSQVQLLGVDANPQATSVSDVMDYSRAHEMVNQWDFLTGPAAQLRATWKAYHIAVQIDSGEIDHTPALLVIDQRGHERKIYLTQMAYASITQSAQLLAQEVATLLPGHPKLTDQASLAHIAGLSPTSAVTMPTVPSGSVTLGPGKARLVMFFATWVGETSDLRGQLLALNAYQKAARSHGLPGLVAVDEASTEPSPAAARGYLAKLGSPLSYPVGVDSAGRLADGYGVEDQPWFVLLSASGKILWKHDGWLSVHDLEAAAAKA